MSGAVLLQDNQSTIHLAQKGSTTSGRSRHIKVRHFFVKDLVQRGELNIQYVPTEDMLADMLTKPLGPSAFRRFRDSLLGHT